MNRQFIFRGSLDAKIEKNILELPKRRKGFTVPPDIIFYEKVRHMDLGS